MRAINFWFHKLTCSSGVGTNFVLQGPRWVDQNNNEINKDRILETITWNLIIGGTRPPCWIIGGGGGQWPPLPPPVPTPLHVQEYMYTVCSYSLTILLFACLQPLITLTVHLCEWKVLRAVQVHFQSIGAGEEES